MFLSKNLTLSGPSIASTPTSSPRAVSQDRMSLVDLGKRLLEAAKKGDTEEVRTLMSSGAPFTTDWLGTSPLHFAAQKGHLQTAEVLLRAGISRDARTKVDRTPLHAAAQTGHVQIVELLIRNQADIEAKDMLKMTPLHWASEMGHLPVVELLVKQGANIQCENKFDKTPIDIAGAKGRVDILTALSQDGEIIIPATAITEEEIATEEIAMETVVTETEIQTATDSIPVCLSSVSSHHGSLEAVPLTIVENSHKSTVTTAGGTEQSSTSVLATLAALAEATAPITTVNASTTDAMNWLENHGITMISTNDGNILASAVESGQSITLTEAGKLAINLIKQQSMAQNSSEEDGETMVTKEPDSVVINSAVENVVGDAGTPKVITIVSEEGHHIPTSDSQVLVEVTTNDMAEQITDPQAAGDTSEPPTKRLKTEGEVTDVDISKLIQVKGVIVEPENDNLRRQLEEVQRQAQEYKQQLMQKEKETEVYKKQLIALTPTKKS